MKSIKIPSTTCVLTVRDIVTAHEVFDWLDLYDFGYEDFLVDMYAGQKSPSGGGPIITTHRYRMAMILAFMFNGTCEIKDANSL